MKNLINRLVGIVDNRFFESLALFVVRLALAGVFWRSARLKVEEGSIMTIKDSTFFQFSDAPFNNVPILNGDLGAYVTTAAEHILPIMLVLGLATRLSAAGLLVMTLVIQTFVFPTTAHFFGTAILWIGMALVIIARGGGLFSMDRLFDRLWTPRA